MPRPFASGSRQAPDPYDQFLEQRGFYRKHTARDSSCLFRSISEQMYDTQLHHLIIRQRCVDYMRKCKSLFQKGIDKDIDEYLDEMSKPKTYGTLLELRAIAYMYKRNVILFEAYNTGTQLIKEDHFEEVFRVFFTPERHFDTVFTSGFIETAAFCQGVCYEILYKHVFKLPDVMYAVEQMLHGNTLEFVKFKTQCVGPYPKRIIYADGRGFDLNTPEETNCILDNRILCHFHNPNFPQFADNLHHDMHLIEAAQYDNQKITKTLDSLLPEKYISCVQQLLKDGITPFPYKVAKALDPDIYRNIEFDAWSEQRKEQRFKNWYTGGANLQIGVKCLVKLGSSQNNLYNCHIQDMSPEKGPCLVYIEELAQKHTVPYESLQPLPSELAKPWPLPFRYQKHIDRCPDKVGSNDGKKCRKLNGKSRYRELISTIKKEIYTEDEITSNKDDVSYQLKQFTSIQHYYPQSYEMLAMPFNVDHSSNSENIRQSRRNSVNSALSHLTSGTDTKHDTKKDDEKDLDFASSDHFAAYGPEGYPDSFYAYPYENSVIHAGPHNPFYCMYNSQPFPTPPGPVVPHGVYVQSTASGAQPVSSTYFPALSTLPPPPPPIFSVMSSTSSNTMTTSNVCRHHTGALSALPGRVNFAATRSILPSGDDLPQDVPTLRFFYNLGFDYFQMQKSTETNTTNEKGDTVHKLAIDLQTNIKLDKENSMGNTVKLDHTHNVNQTSTHHSTKRFSSRYFNSKRNEKHTSRAGAVGGTSAQRSNHVELPGKQSNAAGTKINPVSSGATAVGMSSHSKVSASNTTGNNNSSEQTIQTSPTSTLITTETWSNDFINNSPLYSTQAGPMSYSGPCMPLYPDSESQPGVYVQTPTIMTVPYGMYPIPQHPHPGPTFQTYLPPPNSLPMIPPPPPAFPGNPFMTSGSVSDPTPIVVNSDSVDNGSYAFMGFPPIYYSPTSNGSGMPATGTSMQPAYWYPAGPPLTTSVTPTATPNNNTSTPSAASAISISSR